MKLLALDGLDGLDGLASASSKSNVVTKKRSSSEICIPELDDINMYYICIHNLSIDNHQTERCGGPFSKSSQQHATWRLFNKQWKCLFHGGSMGIHSETDISAEKEPSNCLFRDGIFWAGLHRLHRRSHQFLLRAFSSHGRIHRNSWNGLKIMKSLVL